MNLSMLTNTHTMLQIAAGFHNIYLSKHKNPLLYFGMAQVQTSFIDSSKNTITVIYLEQAGISISAFVMHLLIP